jgi:hypothetical protein
VAKRNKEIPLAISGSDNTRYKPNKLKAAGACQARFLVLVLFVTFVLKVTCFILRRNDSHIENISTNFKSGSHLSFLKFIWEEVQFLLSSTQAPYSPNPSLKTGFQKNEMVQGV